MQKHSTKPTKRTDRKGGTMEPTEYTAKNGDLVLDLVAEGRNKRREAKIVLNFLKSPIQPWLREAVIDSLNTAAERVKLAGHSMAPQSDWDVLGLELLFTLAQGNLANFSLRHSERDKVLRSLSELLHNPETPQNLFEGVAEFVSDQANLVAGIGNIFHRDPVLAEILKTVGPEDTHGALCARVEAEFGGGEVSHATN